jgi:hypothetical protein
VRTDGHDLASLKPSNAISSRRPKIAAKAINANPNDSHEAFCCGRKREVAGLLHLGEWHVTDRDDGCENIDGD